MHTALFLILALLSRFPEPSVQLLPSVSRVSFFTLLQEIGICPPPQINYLAIFTSIYQPTNAHIISHKTLLKQFKTLRHVSILSDHNQGALFLAKVILQYSQFSSYLQTKCCGSISCCVGMCCGAVVR